MATAAANVVLGHYQVNLLDKLGQGVFGIVFRGTDSRRSTRVAVKQMELKKDDKAGADKVGSDAMTEIKNLQKLPSHPHIVKFFDFHFQANSFWLVMEFCNFGNLSQYFDKHKPIDFVTKVELMQQAASAIAHLHGLPVPIVHRDLKPANIMLHYTGDRPVVKVTDFGLAKVAEDKADMAKTFLMSTVGGTPAFMAPEFFMKQKYTSSVDVFALGLVFLGMLNYDEIGDILPVFGTDFMIMPLGIVIAQALQSGSSLPKLVEIKSSDSREMKDVKEVIKKMVMPKKEDRIKSQTASTNLKDIFDKLKDHLSPPPPLPTGIVEAEADVPNNELLLSDDSEGGDIGYQLLRQAAGQMLEEKGRPEEEGNAKKDLLEGGKMPLLEMLLLQALGEDGEEKELPGGLKKGDKVRVVESDVERAKKLQDDYGGWVEAMEQYLGKEGEVQRKVLHVIKVKFPDGVSWSFNPTLLEKVESDGSSNPIVNSRTSRMQEVVQGLFHRFDVVQIPKEKSVVEVLQEGHGGWNDRMKLCLGIKGLVNRVDKDGDVFVECINGDDWTFNPELLIKVEPDPDAKKEAGDFVLVMDDVDTVRQLQVDHGGWARGMEKCCGHTGIIKAVLPNDRLRIEVAHNTWIFNKNVITLVAKGEELLQAILRRKLKL